MAHTPLTGGKGGRIDHRIFLKKAIYVLVTERQPVKRKPAQSNRVAGKYEGRKARRLLPLSWGTKSKSLSPSDYKIPIREGHNQGYRHNGKEKKDY